jgi:hypothetical protein
MLICSGLMQSSTIPTKTMGLDAHWGAEKPTISHYLIKEIVLTTLVAIKVMSILITPLTMPTGTVV